MMEHAPDGSTIELVFLAAAIVLTLVIAAVFVFVLTRHDSQ